MPSPFDDIFGRPGPEWTWPQMEQHLDAVADQYRVPRDLVRAVVKQESNWDPHATGDGGKARGFFQLHAGAAQDAGIDPAHRDDIGLNILGGVRYLRLKLDQAGGDMDKALRLYNGGGDPNYVANVRRWLSPARAEAQAPQQAPSSAVWDDIFGGQAPPAPATRLAPPTARSTPEEAAAYRQWAAQQLPAATSTPAPVSPTPPAPPPLGQASQGPPAPSPADAQYAAQTMAQMRQRQTPRTVVTDPAALLAVGGGPQAPQAAPQPVTDPAALLAVGGGQAPVPQTSEQQIVDAARERQRQQGTPSVPLPPGVPTVEQETLEEQNPAQKWIDTALDVGYGAMGAVVGGATGGLPGMIAGPVIAQGALDRARMQLGMRPQEQAVFELGPVNVYQSDLLNAGFSLLLGTPDIVKSVLSRTQAGRAIRAADDATRAAHQEWQAAVTEAKTAQQAGRQEAYQTAERKVLDAQARYQQKVQAREQTIREHQQGYDEALTQYQQEVQTARGQAHQARTGEIAQEQRAYAGQVARQATDVQAQQQAIRSARAVPGRYSPETPSWVLYEKFGDVAKNEGVDLAPAKTGLAEVRASRGVLPDGTARPFPAQVEQIASTLERAEGRASVQTIRNELRRLAPLTRSPNGDIRGPAKQLYGLYADALEASPAANDLLRQANATFRREMALQDVSDWLRPGRGIVRIDQQGRETINVGALLTRLEKTVGEDTLFARSFAPDELTALRQDVGRLAGTPRMPTRTPQAPRPELLPGSAADVPAPLREAPTPPGTPAEVPRPRVEALPGGAGPGRRVPGAGPEPAPVTPREQLGERPKVSVRSGAWADVLLTMQALGIPTTPIALIRAGYVTQQQGRWLLSHALLSPKLRPLVEAGLDRTGRLDRRIYGALKLALSPEERRQFVRETR